MPLSSLPRSVGGGGTNHKHNSSSFSSIKTTEEDAACCVKPHQNTTKRPSRRSTEVTVDETLVASGEFSVSSSVCSISSSIHSNEEEAPSSPQAVHPQVIIDRSYNSCKVEQEEEASAAAPERVGTEEDNNDDLFFSAQEWQPQNALEKVQREIKLQSELLVWKQQLQQQQQQQQQKYQSITPPFSAPKTTTDDSHHASSCSTATAENTVASTTTQYLKDCLQFELQYSLPGSAALLLTCLAHASTYEGISNVAYEAVEHETARQNHGGWMHYTLLLVVGCLLARWSGLQWEFISPQHYRRVQFDLHNRLRLQTIDSRWCRQFQKYPDVLQGLLQMAAFYLCYIAMVFYLQQVAIHVDQRQSLLAHLPSVVYRQQLQQLQEQQLFIMNSTSWDPPLGGDSCWQDGTPSSTPTTPTTRIHEQHQQQETEELMLAFGLEDDAYFYQRLSKNSYETFFGQDYEAAMFDTPHHLLFYVTVVGLSVGVLKTYYGFSFWANW